TNSPGLMVKVTSVKAMVASSPEGKTLAMSLSSTTFMSLIVRYGFNNFCELNGAKQKGSCIRTLARASEDMPARAGRCPRGGWPATGDLGEAAGAWWDSFETNPPLAPARAFTFARLSGLGRRAGLNYRPFALNDVGLYSLRLRAAANDADLYSLR